MLITTNSTCLERKPLPSQYSFSPTDFEGIFKYQAGKGPVKISDAVELPGFAFHVYDVDFTTNSLTMTLVAQLEKLQITLYDDSTFDRYYFAFDQEITSAELSDKTDANFEASVEIVGPGTQITSSGSFVDGLATEYTFDKGGILITIGEGTDLTKISENGGSLTVNF